MYHLDFEKICPLLNAIFQDTFKEKEAIDRIYPGYYELFLDDTDYMEKSIKTVTLCNLHENDPTFNVVIPGCFHGANVCNHLKTEVAIYNKIIQRQREEDRITDPEVKKVYRNLAGVVDNNEGRPILLGFRLNDPKLDFLDKAELGGEILNALHNNAEYMSGLDVKKILSHCDLTHIYIRKPEALEEELLGIVEETRQMFNNVGKVLLHDGVVYTGVAETDEFILRILERLFNYCDKTRY